MVDPLEQSSALLLFPRPDWEVGVESFQKDPCQQKIGDLLAKLQREGPFVAQGPVGPGAYFVRPYEVKNLVGGQRTYGWKRGTKRRRRRDCPLFVLGARRVREGGFVYFSLAKGCASLLPLSPRYRSSDLDQRIYVTSFRSFACCLVGKTLSTSLRTATSSASENELLCTPEEEECVRKLGEMDLESILDGGKGKEHCRELGQKVFDAHKGRSGSSCLAGSAMQRVLEALSLSFEDSHVRGERVERAWEGVGDDSWQWGIGELPK